MKPNKVEINHSIAACDDINLKSSDPIEQTLAAAVGNALRWVVRDTDWPSPAAKIKNTAKSLRKKLKR